jgi:predicted RNA binding protein YcfA (HicA-like mRNA interferase family)
LLAKAQRNPAGLSFNEFQTLMSQCSWKEDHQRGSHSIWYSPKKIRISVQNNKGMAKSYQVKQFLNYYQEENDDA